ncbi:hypothetical protein GCM10007886_06370 [Methylobacterium gregans]|uniref:Uncharacterized protein n=1 Tax=Methylobacterium gregans TaxID=374424 RepID=A0AA37HK50_9HYPH|nr:hypothetical protein [Methylobacterium gregans]GJD77004.1 hypothetical protein NBEOAGPD_0205 [Methylobacterium gregans]GLS52454.1 hypothetical protein GCM10007886_06370 [Methylobacterium gregans]
MISSTGVKAAQMRQAAENAFAEEIAALKASDDRPRPSNWQMSPQAVVTYLLGGKLASGFEITP